MIGWTQLAAMKKYEFKDINGNKNFKIVSYIKHVECLL